MVFGTIYEKYRRGEDVYLGCVCAPQKCHGDIIKEKLRRRMILDMVADKKNNR